MLRRNMIPPGFVRFYEEKGVQKPYCFECTRFAIEVITSRGICLGYGSYVSLYSSCSAFERRVNSSIPVVSAEALKAKFRFGLNDLLKLAH
jgi:hypothetical protein